ncbi:MAG: phage major tail tube protein [Pseudomonadota bacterium]|nr:phage major tail tube protein [Pseudomonadota bacterium]
MAKTEKARFLTTGTAMGFPIMEQIDSFTPPVIEKMMTDLKGGRFAADEIMTGLEKLEFTLVLNGAPTVIKQSLGVAPGNPWMLDIREGGKDAQGETWFTNHICAGEIKRIEEADVKSGELKKTTIRGKLHRYQTLENGVPVIHIDTRRQIVNLGGGDLMEDIRRVLLLP